MMNIRNFVNELASSSDRVSERIRGLSEGEQRYTNELIELIKEVIAKKEAVLLEYVLIVAAHDGLNKGYTTLLCYLLSEKWHYSHEDIIMLLEEIRDPESVECVYNASFFVIDYDDGKSLAKKCIWALGAINTEYSRGKLKQLSYSEDMIIKEAAIMQLNHIEGN